MILIAARQKKTGDAALRPVLIKSPDESAHQCQRALACGTLID